MRKERFRPFLSNREGGERGKSRGSILDVFGFRPSSLCSPLLQGFQCPCFDPRIYKDIQPCRPDLTFVLSTMEDAQFENWRPNRPLRLVDGFCVIRRGAEAPREDGEADIGAAAGRQATAAATTSSPGHRRDQSSAVASFLKTRLFEPRATDWFLWKTEKEVRKMCASSPKGSEELPVSDRIHISDPSMSKTAVVPERLLQICPFVFPDKISIARDPGEPSLHSFALTDGSGAQSCTFGTWNFVLRFNFSFSHSSSPSLPFLRPIIFLFSFCPFSYPFFHSFDPL